MKATVLHLLRELAHRQALAEGNPGSIIDTPIDFRAADVARRLGVPEKAVENALDTLVDEQAVTRHSLGQFALTNLGARKSRCA